MNIDRQKLMVGAVLALIALWLAFQYYIDPWWADMKQANTNIDRLNQQVAAARNTLSTRDAVQKEWKTIEGKLKLPKESDTLTDFIIGVGDLCTQAGVQGLATKPGRDQKVGDKGDFIEYSLDTTFQASWHPFVTLLFKIMSEPRFIKVQRLAVTSKYEKEDKLEIEMRVSTIEVAPKAGGK